MVYKIAGVELGYSSLYATPSSGGVRIILRATRHAFGEREGTQSRKPYEPHTPSISAFHTGWASGSEVGGRIDEGISYMFKN